MENAKDKAPEGIHTGLAQRKNLVGQPPRDTIQTAITIFR
jgi:hypothetical protein